MTINVASGVALSAPFRVPGNTGAMGILVPSGTVGQVRIDFAATSAGPWHTLMTAGAHTIVTSGPLSAGYVTPLLGSFARINLSANQTDLKAFGVNATRVN